MKKTRISKTDESPEGRKDNRQRHQDIAHIIAAGLQAGASKGKTRQAIALYCEVTNSPTEDMTPDR